MFTIDRPSTVVRDSAAPWRWPVARWRGTGSAAATGWCIRLLHQPTERLDVRLRLLATERRPLAHWTPVHLHLGAVHVPARVALLAGDALAPGDEDLAQLVPDRPIGALHGDRLILRDQSAQRTIGGGVRPRSLAAGARSSPAAAAGDAAGPDRFGAGVGVAAAGRDRARVDRPHDVRPGVEPASRSGAGNVSRARTDRLARSAIRRSP